MTSYSCLTDTVLSRLVIEMVTSNTSLQKKFLFQFLFSSVQVSLISVSVLK